MRPKVEWAIDSEGMRARGIIVKYRLGKVGRTSPQHFEENLPVCYNALVVLLRMDQNGQIIRMDGKQ